MNTHLEKLFFYTLPRYTYAASIIALIAIGLHALLNPPF